MPDGIYYKLKPRLTVDKGEWKKITASNTAALGSSMLLLLVSISGIRYEYILLK